MKKLKSMFFVLMAGCMLFTFAACKTTPPEVEKPVHEHTYATTWSNDATNHWHAATCEHTSEKKDNAAHTWGTGAKADECTVCGYARAHTHTFDTTKWQSDENQHWRAATCAHTTEKGSAANHTWGTGANANKCTVCNYEKATTNPGGDDPVTPPTPAGGVITDSKLPDNHQGEGATAKDAKWARYDLYAASAPETGEAASYVKIVDGVAANQNWSTNRINDEKYYPIGNMNKNTGLTVTYTIYASEAGEVGIYGQFSNRAAAETPIPFTEIFSLTVNGAKQECTGVNLPQDGSNYAPTNAYLFLSFVNLKAGENTVVLTVVMENSANNGYNFYGFRFSAEKAQIGITAFTGGTTNPPAGDLGVMTNSKVPDLHQNSQEKDATWTRYTFPVATEDGKLASYFVTAGSQTGSLQSDATADLDGYVGLGGLRSQKDGDTVTFYVNASAAGEVGLYVQLSVRTDGAKISDYFTLTVNGTAVPADVTLSSEGTANGPTNQYQFIGYVNLVAGNNTITFTKNATSFSGAGFNWYGLRISAQTAKMTPGTPAAAAAEVALLPGKD